MSQQHNIVLFLLYYWKWSA